MPRAVLQSLLEFEVLRCVAASWAWLHQERVRYVVMLGSNPGFTALNVELCRALQRLPCRLFGCCCLVAAVWLLRTPAVLQTASMLVWRPAIDLLLTWVWRHCCTAAVITAVKAAGEDGTLWADACGFICKLVGLSVSSLCGAFA